MQSTVHTTIKGKLSLAVSLGNVAVRFKEDLERD